MIFVLSWRSFLDVPAMGEGSGSDGLPISCGVEVGHLLPGKFGPGGEQFYYSSC